MTESQEVPCIYCGGTGQSSTPFRSGKEEAIAANTACSECAGSGKMEIRRTGDSNWESCCPTCEGKGFNDDWDIQREEHLTPECENCEGTGGIAYIPASVNRNP